MRLSRLHHLRLPRCDQAVVRYGSYFARAGNQPGPHRCDPCCHPQRLANPRRQFQSRRKLRRHPGQAVSFQRRAGQRFIENQRQQAAMHPARPALMLPLRGPKRRILVAVPPKRQMKPNRVLRPAPKAVMVVFKQAAVQTEGFCNNRSRFAKDRQNTPVSASGTPGGHAQ